MPIASLPKAQMSRRTTIAMGLVFIGAGLYPLAIGSGLVAFPPDRLHAPLWVVSMAGACFILIGSMLLIPDNKARLRRFMGGVFVTAFAVIFDWIAFAPGECHFSGGLSFSGFGIMCVSSYNGIPPEKASIGNGECRLATRLQEP